MKEKRTEEEREEGEKDRRGRSMEDKVERRIAWRATKRKARNDREESKERWEDGRDEGNRKEDK